MKLLSLCLLAVAFLAACGNAQEHTAKACFYIDANKDPHLADQFDYGRIVIPQFEAFAKRNFLETAGELAGGHQSFRNTKSGVYIGLTFGMGNQKASVSLYTHLEDSDEIFSRLSDFLTKDMGTVYDVYPCADSPDFSQMPVLFGVDLYAT